MLSCSSSLAEVLAIEAASTSVSPAWHSQIYPWQAAGHAAGV